MSSYAEKVVTLRDGRVAALEPAREEDAEAILAYMHAVLPEVRPYVLTLPEEFTMTLEQEREWLRTRIGATVLAWVDGEVVGMCNGVANARRRRTAHVANIGMTLRRAWGGVGLGETMLRRLIAWAEAEPGIIKLTLAVYADNERALRLYRKCGFVEEARLVAQTQREPGEFVDDVLMCRFVKPMAVAADADGSGKVAQP